MRSFLFLSCFLIISCDSPSEANKDCSGVKAGLAEIDDCGRCAGGETGYVTNGDKDCCGDCFGDHLDCEDPCYGCDDQDAINSSDTDCTFEFNAECEGHLDIDSPCDAICDEDDISLCLECDTNGEAIFQHNSDMCIYDLCTDYFESNDDFNCDTAGSPPYALGEQLDCETLETEFNICYPECENLVKLADFEDKIIFIIYEENW